MSINKGKEYEREIAKTLSAWAGIELVRTPDGAPEAIYGDIWPKNTSEQFALSVECKRGEDWTFDQIMAGCGLFYSWAEQAYQQAYTASRSLHRPFMPALIFRRSWQPSMIALGYLQDNCATSDMLLRACAQDHVPTALVHVPLQVPEKSPSVGFEYDGPVHSMYAVMLLSQFLESYSYPKLLEHIQRLYDI